MKKWKWGTVALFSTLLITACGETEEGASEEGLMEEEGVAVEEQEEAPAEEESLTAEEVLAQSTEAMSEVESYSMELNINQEMQVDEETIPMDMTLQMDVTQNPMMLKQVMTMPDMTGEGEMEIEQYMDEDGTMYMYDAATEQWMRLDASAMGITDLQDLEMSPQEQLELLQDMSESIEITETEEYYELSVVGSGEGIKELAMQFANLDGDPAMQGELDEVMSHMDIETLDYVIKIDKETFYQTEININMEMSMEAEGQTLVMKQVSEGTISQYDEIDQIEIPEEAKENAVDVQEQMEQMEQMEEDAA